MAAIPNTMANTSLEQHFNLLHADGRGHGFDDGFAGFPARVTQAMDSLREKNIVTAEDPFEAMQQAADWLMDNAGGDDVFSFGGGGEGENDSIRLSNESGVSIADINTIKFMFDNVHDAELRADSDTFLNVNENKDAQVFQELADIIGG